MNQSLGIKRKYIGGTKGSHLIVTHPELHSQLRGRMVYFGSKDGRICLVYPFMDRLLVGSTDIRVSDPDQIRCEDSEVEYMLGVLREIFPRLELDASNITFRYSGVRPLPYSDAANPGDVSRDHVVHIDHLPDTRIPVLSLVGGKWTTFRGFSESVADDTLKRLGRTRRVSTRDEAIGGGHDFPRNSGDRAAWINALAARCGVPGAAIEQLLSMHPATPDARCRAEHAGHPLPVMLAALAEQAVDRLSGAVLLVKGLHVVPEFLGNRAPLADPHARAVIAGLGMESDLDSLVSLYIAGICSIGYGLRQIIEAQTIAGAPIERVVISGGAGRLDLVRQLLADATGKRVLATQAEEPVLLGAAMLGGVAGGLFDDVLSAMTRMSHISKIYEPDAGDIAALHEARFRAFKQLQSVAREIR